MAREQAWQPIHKLTLALCRPSAWRVVSACRVALSRIGSYRVASVVSIVNGKAKTNKWSSMGCHDSCAPTVAAAAAITGHEQLFVSALNRTVLFIRTEASRYPLQTVVLLLLSLSTSTETMSLCLANNTASASKPLFLAAPALAARERCARDQHIGLPACLRGAMAAPPPFRASRPTHAANPTLPSRQSTSFAPVQAGRQVGRHTSPV